MAPPLAAIKADQPRMAAGDASCGGLQSGPGVTAAALMLVDGCSMEGSISDGVAVFRPSPARRKSGRLTGWYTTPVLNHGCIERSLDAARWNRERRVECSHA